MNAAVLTGAGRTLLVPLWCRARCALLYPGLGVGEDDALLLRRLRADFSQALRADCALYALRELFIRRAAEGYLALRPGAAVIDLGCGLDTLARRLPGSGARIYADLPEVIELRRELLPPGPGEAYVSADLSGGAGALPAAEDGAFIIMGGLLGHLAPARRDALLASLAAAYPGCGAAFDGVSGAAFALAGRGMGLASPLPGVRRLLRGGSFSRLEAPAALPVEFRLVPAAERLKLAALLRCGALRLYRGEFAGI